MGPSCGTSWMRSIERMWSSVSIEGDRPPCRQKICDAKHGTHRQHVVERRESDEERAARRTWSSMRAVRGRKSNRSVKYFHTLALPYLRRHSS